jgi:hypothetical protein
MGKGVSIFLGLKYSLEENIKFMRFAKKNGFEKIFTSLHIPEADYGIIINEFNALVKEAKLLGMEVIADISPKGFELLNIRKDDLKSIKRYGIDVLRIDFGFTPEEIANFSRNSWGLKIEINASTVTETFLKALDIYNPCYKNIQGCHNYYPRINTGISEQSIIKKNDMLKKFNLSISAFIPSLINKRGPIHEGLPTLEMHRHIAPEISAKHLYALGIDNVFFGDSIPSEKEILEVGFIPENIVELKVLPLTKDEISLKLLNHCYTNRSDSAEDVIRAVESRMNINYGTIKPKNTTYRNKGTVTVDNEAYLRYMGELQICKIELPEDSRVNIIGRVIDEELFLLDYIDDETKFRFKLI